MPVFAEDPARLSVSRLRSDLVAHQVRLPPAGSRKEVYVELHLRHVDRRNPVGFSSDEEEEEKEKEKEDGEEAAEAQEGEDLDYAERLDPGALTDDDLRAALLLHGVKAGPIVASTRALYEKKLRNLLRSDRPGELNGGEARVLYSDSEEEGDAENAEESGVDRAAQEMAEPLEQEQKDTRQSGDVVYKQYYLPSSRLRARAPRSGEPAPGRNSANALESSGQSWAAAQTASGIRESSMESRRSLSRVAGELNESNEQKHRSRSGGLDKKVAEGDSRKKTSLYSRLQKTQSQQRPVDDAFKDFIPDSDTTSPATYATRRRPIKGAAGRPVQYIHPDSPTALERQNLQRPIAPIHIQIFVFFIVAFLIYLVYACVGENPLSLGFDLPGGPNLAAEEKERRLLPADTQETQTVVAQE